LADNNSNLHGKNLTDISLLRGSNLVIVDSNNSLHFEPLSIYDSLVRCLGLFGLSYVSDGLPLIHKADGAEVVIILLCADTSGRIALSIALRLSAKMPAQHSIFSRPYVNLSVKCSGSVDGRILAHKVRTSEVFRV
jgi:hypothetical protein